MGVDCICEKEADTRNDTLGDVKGKALADTHCKTLRSAKTHTLVSTPCDVETDAQLTRGLKLYWKRRPTDNSTNWAISTPRHSISGGS